MLFTNQFFAGQMESSIDNSFSVSNGVKQGGVLSPVLLPLYIDGLLKILGKKVGFVIMWEIIYGWCIIC